MTAKAPLVHLDSNVVTGLVLDDVARDWVREERRNGGRILLSPSIIHEIARAPKPTRIRLIAGAIEYCDAFINLPIGDILKIEIDAINAGVLVPEIPTLPIVELRRLYDEA